MKSKTNVNIIEDIINPIPEPMYPTSTITIISIYVFIPRIIQAIIIKRKTGNVPIKNIN